MTKDCESRRFIEMSPSIHTSWTPLRQQIYWTKMLLVFGTVLFFYVCHIINPVPYNYFPQILELRITDDRSEDLIKLPRRESRYSVVTSNMSVSMSDLPQWSSCPPAETVNSIWSMAANDHEALYSSVLAESLKVSFIWRCLHYLTQFEQFKH